MRILCVIPYYVPAYSYGGPVKVAHDLNREFVKKGHSVTVLTTDVHDAQTRNAVKTENLDGVEIIRFRNLSNYLAKNYNAYLPFGFGKWLRKNLQKYDIVHCHDFFTVQNIVTAKYCRKYKVPFVVQPHGCLDGVRMQAKSSGVKKFFLKCFDDVLNQSKAVLALTEHEKRSIASILNNVNTNTPQPPQGGKIRVIPNGIDLDEFVKIKKMDLHKKYSLTPETKLLFYFGRVQHIKGIDYILQTLSQLSTLNAQLKYHFFIVGPDEDGEKARLEKLIIELKLRKNVTFTGQLNGEEKKSFLAACDLFLFLSRGEGLPMTILEVAALGIPSVLSTECYVPEIAEGGGGYEVEKEDYEKNAKLIAECFEKDAEERRMFKKNARKVVEDKFGLDVVVEKVLESYC